MTKTQQILDTIAAHPEGITNAGISMATKISTSHVATVTGQKFRAGKLTRKEAGATPSGIVSYRYFPVAGASKKAAPLAKVSKRPDSFETLLDTLAKSMADQVMARMRTHLVERLEQHQSYVPALPAPPKAPEVTKEKVRLPRIGVTGLLPQQAGVIQTEFCETFDISFWNDRQGDSSEKLRSIGIACEAVFIHTDHSSHQVDKLLASVGAKIVRVPGGISALRTALTQHYLTQTEGV